MPTSITPESYARPIEILLVDDDDDDVRLTKKSLENDRIANHVHRVEDGVEAMSYLRREGSFSDAVQPDLILLDLNMPRMDGRDVLREIKNDEALKQIPVIILTTSEDEKDVLESYQHRANSYITKPADLAQFRQVLTTLGDYWFCVVKFPPRKDMQSQ